jgi:hypothetical protein
MPRPLSALFEELRREARSLRGLHARIRKPFMARTGRLEPKRDYLARRQIELDVRDGPELHGRVMRVAARR